MSAHSEKEQKNCSHTTCSGRYSNHKNIGTCCFFYRRNGFLNCHKLLTQDLFWKKLISCQNENEQKASVSPVSFDYRSLGEYFGISISAPTTQSRKHFGKTKTKEKSEKLLAEGKRKWMSLSFENEADGEFRNVSWKLSMCCWHRLASIGLDCTQTLWLFLSMAV